MNYMEARKLSDGPGWHMTVRNDDWTWTHVCCREAGAPATEEQQREFGFKPGELTLGEPHAPHETREEAEDCYHRWRLRRIEETLEFDDAVFGDWTGCRAVVDDTGEKLLRCDAPTKGGARYGDDHRPEQLPLCPDHRDPWRVLGQIGRVTTSIYS